MFTFLAIIIIVINPSNQLSQHSLTIRFTEYITSDKAVDCGWDCQCPDLNEDNLCLCRKEDMNNNETFSIESPYAAILVQKQCESPQLQWTSDTEKIEIDMAAMNENEYLSGYYVDREKEPILERIKLMPTKHGKVRFLMKKNKNDDKYFELSYRGMEEGLYDEWGDQELHINDLYILIPGWNSDLDGLFSAYEEVLDGFDGMMVIDWLHYNQYYLHENERIYEQVVANTVLVGYQLGLLLDLGKSKGLFKHKIHIIGFGVGSQIAHFASKQIAVISAIRAMEESGVGMDYDRGIDRITALDPPRYLFEGDTIRRTDAKFVDVYHSNVGYESDNLFNLEKSLLKRKFGDNRNLGHVNFIINPDGHDQCKIDGDEIAYGCPGMMAARTFLDTILRKDRTFFKAKNEEGTKEVVFGIYAQNDEEGIYFIKSKTICYNDMWNKIYYDDFISDDDKGRLLGPFKRVSNERVKATAPIDEPLNTIPKDKDEDPNCGEFNNNFVTSRVWEGRNGSDYQFPWTVCIKSQKVEMYKYSRFVVDGKLYARSQNSMPPDNVYSLYERINVDDEDWDSSDNFGWRYSYNSTYNQACTGSLIDPKGWIITAAHCFDRAVNGIGMKFIVGRKNCGKQNEGIEIFIEKIGPKREQNVFLPKATEDNIQNAIDLWMDRIATTGEGYATEDELRTLKKAEPRKEFNKFINEWFSVPSQKQGKCVVKEKYERVKIFRNKLFRTYAVWGTDIALVKVSMRKVRNNKNIKHICYLSSVSFNYNDYNQFIYFAGYGIKGPFEDTIESAYLSWITFLNKQQIETRSNNEITFEPPELGRIKSPSQLWLANGDKINTTIVTSATCGGDSGGPFFVYALHDGTKYALQIGLTQGQAVHDATGTIAISRGVDMTEDKYDSCVHEFRYNVYAKKYFIAPDKITVMSQFVKWIASTIKDNPESQKRKGSDGSSQST